MPLRVCLRARLLLPFPCHDDASLANGNTTHCNKRVPSGELCGVAIRGAADRHVWWCSKGGSVIRGHNAVRDWLASWLLTRTGSAAALRDVTEQRVQQWDRTVTVKNAQGQRVPKLEQAVLDVVFTDKSGLLTYADVTFHTAGTGSAADLTRHAGSARSGLADVVDGKLKRYPPAKHPSVGLVPFAVGALGRMSPEAHGLLASMATDSQDARLAYQQLSALTQRRLADVLRASEPHKA